MFESDAAVELPGVVVRAAGEAVDLAARLDPGVLDGAGLLELMGSLERVRRSIDAAQAHVLASLHEADAARGEGLATSAWLARECGQAVGVARDRLSASLKLRRELPVVDAELVAGRIGWQHVEVFCQAVNVRNVEAFGELCGELCELAGRHEFSRWRSAVLALGRHLDPDGPEPEDRSRSHLRVSPSDLLATVHGEFIGADAVIAREQLNAVADELYRRYVADRDRFGEGRVPPRSELLAEAFVELCRRAAGVDPDTATAPRAEATVVLHTDGTTQDPGTPPELALLDDLRRTSHPDHPHTRPEAWRALGAAGVVATAERLRLPMSDAALLVCSAVLQVVAMDSAGRPLTDARPVYRPSRRQRRDLELRDGGCTFPGCRVRWTDAHHLTPWPAGRTALDNLALLCRRHHRAVHRDGWTVELTDDGWTRWTSPRGTIRSGQRHQQTRAGP